MHLFVTGGTGFFGKALLRHWQQGPPNFAVTILSRDPDAFRARHAELLAGLDVRLVRGDVTDASSLPSETFTHLLHAATESTNGPQLTPQQRFDHSVDGTRNVLDLAVRLGAQRVLFTSSGGVYGPPPPGVTKLVEDFNGIPDPLEPQNSYSIAKRVGEHLCALYASERGLEPVIARCFAFAGEDLPPDVHFAIGNFVADALVGRDIVIRGDGTPVRSYMDQRDLAEWLMVLLTDACAGRAYNVGSDEAYSLAEVADFVVKAAETGADVQVLGTPPTGGERARSVYVPDITRARTELGLEVRHDLATTLQHMIARLRERG